MLKNIIPPHFAAFFSDAKIQAELKKPLTETLDPYKVEVPSTKEAYRELVSSLNLGSAKAREAYVALLRLSETAAQYYASLDATQQWIEKLTYPERNGLAVTIALRLVSAVLEPRNPTEHANAQRVLLEHESPELRQLAAIIEEPPDKLKKALLAYIKKENFNYKEALKH